MRKIVSTKDTSDVFSSLSRTSEAKHGFINVLESGLSNPAVKNLSLNDRIRMVTEKKGTQVVFESLFSEEASFCVMATEPDETENPGLWLVAGTNQDYLALDRILTVLMENGVLFSTHQEDHFMDAGPFKNYAVKIEFTVDNFKLFKSLILKLDSPIFAEYLDSIAPVMDAKIHQMEEALSQVVPIFSQLSQSIDTVSTGRAPSEVIEKLNLETSESKAGFMFGKDPLEEVEPDELSLFLCVSEDQGRFLTELGFDGYHRGAIFPTQEDYEAMELGEDYQQLDDFICSVIVIEENENYQFQMAKPLRELKALLMDDPHFDTQYKPFFDRIDQHIRDLQEKKDFADEEKMGPLKTLIEQRSAAGSGVVLNFLDSYDQGPNLSVGMCSLAGIQCKADFIVGDQSRYGALSHVQDLLGKRLWRRVDAHWFSSDYMLEKTGFLEPNSTNFQTVEVPGEGKRICPAWEFGIRRFPVDGAVKEMAAFYDRTSGTEFTYFSAYLEISDENLALFLALEIYNNSPSPTIKSEAVQKMAQIAVIPDLIVPSEVIDILESRSALEPEVIDRLKSSYQFYLKQEVAASAFKLGFRS